MADRKAVDYLYKGLKKGYKESDLKKAMAQSGWGAGDIKSALVQAKKRMVSEQDGGKPKQTKPNQSGSKQQKASKTKKPAMQARPNKKEEKSGGFFGFMHKDAGKKPSKPKEQPRPEGKKPKKEVKTQPKTKEENREEKKEEKKDGKKKKGKFTEVDITYVKPKGAVTTEIDDMLELISRKKKIRVNNIAKTLNFKESEIMEWMDTLENWGMIKIHYPLFGKPILKIATKKVPREEAEKSKSAVEVNADDIKKPKTAKSGMSGKRKAKKGKTKKKR